MASILLHLLKIYCSIITTFLGNGGSRLNQLRSDAKYKMPQVPEARWRDSKMLRWRSDRSSRTKIQRWFQSKKFRKPEEIMKPLIGIDVPVTGFLCWWLLDQHGDHLIIHGWKDKLIRMKTGDKYTGMVFQFISLDEEFQDGAKFTHWTTAHEIASKAVETDSCLQKRNSKIDQWLTFFI